MKPARRFPCIERLEDRIAPATFTVTSLFDNTNPGSLRVAIAEANARPGPDTITFQAGLTGTINLALGSLDITDPLTIKGPGAGKLTIDGGDFFDLFLITGGHQTALSGMTLANAKSGQNGAAVSSDGPTTLSDMVFESNDLASFPGGLTGAAVWIHTSGDIVIEKSTFSNNGGLLTRAAGAADLATTGGKIVIKDTLIVANQAVQGVGGLSVALGDAKTSLTVERSTFSSNVSAFGDSGGALQITSLGGAVTVKNSLFTSNRTAVLVNGLGGGAISQTGGSLTVLGSTFSGNESGNGAAIAFSAGTLATIQKSRFELNRSGGAAGGGAVELDGVNVWKVTGSSFTGNIALQDGGAILASGGRGAITGSIFRGHEAGSEGGAVYFTSPGPEALSVTKSSFTGNQANTGGALAMGSGTLTLAGSVIDRNRAVTDGGALQGGGSLSAVGNLFRGNFAGGDGGAVSFFLAEAGRLTIKGGQVSGNVADGAGGGIGLFSAGNTGTALIEKVRFTDNRSATDGGGLVVQLQPASTTTVLGSSFFGNKAAFNRGGGGIYVAPGSVLVLTKTAIIGNLAGNGGGVFSAGTIIPTGNKITGNLATFSPDTSGF